MHRPELIDAASAIALVGLPGSGKSSIGRRLARHLRLPFVDTDAEVERRAGVPIARIFETAGEATFRDMESDALAEALRGDGAVVATGGGVVLRAENRRLLKERATVVFLEAEPAELARRVRPDGRRPLLAGGDVEGRLARLLDEREAFYRDVATVALPPGSRRPEVAVRMICDALRRTGADA